MNRKLILLSFLPAFLIAGVTGLAETFRVRHDHLIGGCEGELVFGGTTVEYRTAKTKHARAWKYADIQQVEIAPQEISIVTYEDRKTALGADRVFRFRLLDGELDDGFRRELEKKVSRPLVSSIVPEETNPRYSIPVRHRRFSGGSQGVLELSEDYIVYRAARGKDSRIWRYDELLSVGSTGPFQLRLGAVQKTGGEYGEEKNYIFDLKRRLRTEEYDFIWTKVNLRDGPR